MDERAGLDVAVRVDVQIVFAARDAAARVFAVVPEVQREQRLRLTERAQLMIHELPLLRRHHQLRHRVLSDRHIGEEPRKFRAPSDQRVDIRFAADDLRIAARIAAAHAEQQPALPEDLHRAHDGVKRAVSAAVVRCILEALDADGGGEVLHAQHLVGEGLVDQGAVREGQEGAVRMRLAQADEVVFAHQRLAAGIDVDVDAQLAALTDDVVEGLVGHIQPVPVFRGPAAGAVQIARRRRIHQNRPRNVAAVLRRKLLFALEADQTAVDEDGFQKLPAHAVIDFRPERADKPVPVVVPVFQHGTHRGDLAFQRMRRVVALQPV